MTVGKLKQLIANLPDDAEVLLDPGSDGLQQTVAYVREVVAIKFSTFSRIYGADGLDSDAFPNAKYGLPKSALIIE